MKNELANLLEQHKNSNLWKKMDRLTIAQAILDYFVANNIIMYTKLRDEDAEPVYTKTTSVD